jgi:hypothetical protein
MGRTAAVAFALIIGLALTSAAEENGQTVTVIVPGNAGGGFGNPLGGVVPFVKALTITKKGKITITYVSGQVTDSGGVIVGPTGTTYDAGAANAQFPLQEAEGVAGGTINDLDALIGAFVPESQISLSGFQPVDGTKNFVAAGIVPSTLFFVGFSETVRADGPGTLFLGINDNFVGDGNGGGFIVTVTGPK